MLGQKGDTIVEVMIVLAVLGTAVSISYVTANRSLLAARAAYENSHGTSLLQSQLEQLRTMPDLEKQGAPNTNVFVPTTPFCIVNQQVQAPGGTPDPCLRDSIYNMSIVYTPDDAAAPKAGGTYVLTGSWDNVAGEGLNTATLSYRMYQ
jgi:prepilin-type N-terminal cleavage/methylation domain-containing protein